MLAGPSWRIASIYHKAYDSSHYNFFPGCIKYIPVENMSPRKSPLGLPINIKPHAWPGKEEMQELLSLFLKGGNKGQEMFHTFPEVAHGGNSRAALVVETPGLASGSDHTAFLCPEYLTGITAENSTNMSAVAALLKLSAVLSLKEAILYAIGNLLER